MKAGREDLELESRRYIEIGVWGSGVLVVLGDVVVSGSYIEDVSDPLIDPSRLRCIESRIRVVLTLHTNVRDDVKMEEKY